MTTTLNDGAERLHRWLEMEALPLWRRQGYSDDRGFVESLTLDGIPTSDPVRARVNPRQVYCFAEAGYRGWKGDWKTAVHGGLDAFDRIYLRRDGFYAHLADRNGTVIDDRVDIYDQAFALLAFAAVAKVRATDRKGMSARAHALLNNLQTNFAHEDIGFAEPDADGTPLRSNPHMHLFEAAQAWDAVDGADTIVFRGLADEIADLCLTRFIDAETGALHEYFDRDWRRAAGVPGSTVEPGHQFEWAWLLARWANMRGGRPELMRAAEKLFDIGETHGVDPARNVAVMGLGSDFAVIDPVARLWSQTEWLKASLLLAEIGPMAARARYERSAERALAAFEAFLMTPLPGLWRDKMTVDGRFVEEPAPASSFYHIVCAIGELAAFAETRRQASLALA